MDVGNVSISDYCVPDDNNTAADDAPNTFMSEAMSFTIYKIGKLALY